MAAGPFKIDETHESLINLPASRQAVDEPFPGPKLPVY